VHERLERGPAVFDGDATRSEAARTWSIASAPSCNDTTTDSSHNGIDQRQESKSRE